MCPHDPSGFLTASGPAVWIRVGDTLSSLYGQDTRPVLTGDYPYLGTDLAKFIVSKDFSLPASRHIILFYNNYYNSTGCRII